MGKVAAICVTGALVGFLLVGGCQRSPPKGDAVVDRGPIGKSEPSADHQDAGLQDIQKSKTALGALGAKFVEDASGNVVEINLAHCDITDASLTHLKVFVQLQRLHLEGTSVTNAGLRHLFALGNLRLVNLGDTKVTAEGRRELRNKLPGATVFPLDPLSGRAGPLKVVPQLPAVHPKVASRLPAVHLSVGHRALCRVTVGDKMPDLALHDFDGRETHLSKHYGEKLTVVVFWAGKHSMARAQIADMGPDIMRPFLDRGVAVVGVVVGDSPKVAKRLLADSKAKFPNLLDRDGSGFAKVGSKKLPRTYVLDHQGNIRWFDIEYSSSTRRELRASILYLLGDD